MSRTSPRRLALLGASTAALALALSACSAGGAQNSTSSSAGSCKGTTYKISMITHETPGDTFWDKIRAGAETAAKNECIKLSYSADPAADKQAQLIQTAVDSKVDGIATTLVTPDALAGSVKAATTAGIPVVGFNSGIDAYKELGALEYFGSDETLAGQTVGERLTADGIKHPLCVIQAAGSVALEARCAGVKAKNSGTENMQVNGTDDSAVVSSIQAKLTQDPSIDAIVTLGAPIAMDALKSKAAANSKATLVTFDLNVDAAQAIKDGKIEFSVDQQPYVQGYMAVTALYLYLKNGNDLGGGGPVLTGPSYVDKTNIDKILPFAKNNTR